MKKLFAPLLALLLVAAPVAQAQIAPPSPAPVSILSGQVSLAVTSSNARVALPSTAASAVAVTIYNKGTVDAFVALGTVTATATSGGTCAAGIAGPSCLVPAGTAITFYSDATYVAAITASSTTSLVIYQGNGPFQLSKAGAGAGASLTQTVGSWTPVDGSGAGLTFTSVAAKYTQTGNWVCAYARLTYPSTADGTGATIAGLPVPVPGQNYAFIPAPFRSTVTLTSPIVLPIPVTSTFELLNGSTNAQLTNAQLSTAQISFAACYPAA